MIPQWKSLILGLLCEKIYSLCHGESNVLTTKKYDQQAISSYQNAIDLDDKTKDEHNLLFYVLICNLCNEEKHSVAAIVAMLQFDLILESENDDALMKKLREMIERVEEKKDNEGNLSYKTIAAIIKTMHKNEDFHYNICREINPLLSYFLF